MPVIALTVAGSDPSGGAGIQADLKTFHQHGVYGTAVISLLTVQNTSALSRIEVMEPELVSQQIDAVANDLHVAAVKTGALGHASVVEAVATSLAHHGLRPVVDPVRISKAGATLLDDAAKQAMLASLIPMAAIVTPNLEEAAWLTGREVESEAQMRDAARALCDLGARAVLIKGGHRKGPPHDVLLAEDRFVVFSGERIDTPHTHGVGCSLSAAICARIAQGEGVLQACEGAKRWLQQAIENAPGIGHGHGPIDHFTQVS